MIVDGRLNAANELATETVLLDRLDINAALADTFSLQDEQQSITRSQVIDAGKVLFDFNL